MKRTVLHVYQDFYPKRGGIEDHVLNLAKAASGGYRHTVLVAAPGPSTRRETVLGVPVVRAATFGRYYTPFCPTMPLWIRRIDPAVVHLHHPSPMAFAAYACTPIRPEPPVIIGYHNDIVRPRLLLRLYAPFQRAVLRRAARILVGTRDYLETSPHLAPREIFEKCAVVPYGIPLEGHDGAEKGAEEKAARIRAAHDGPLVLFVGRLCYYKGLDVAIMAMRKTRHEDAALLLVGEVRRLIENEGMAGRVVPVGAVDDAALWAYYRACDLLVLPSTWRSEAFGLVMLQAHAAGRPVICSDLPGLSTVNVGGETGLLVPPGDADALARAIDALLDDPEARRRMGEEGRRRVERLYTVDLMARRIEAVYDEVLSRPPR